MFITLVIFRGTFNLMSSSWYVMPTSLPNMSRLPCIYLNASCLRRIKEVENPEGGIEIVSKEDDARKTSNVLFNDYEVRCRLRYYYDECN